MKKYFILLALILCSGYFFSLDSQYFSSNKKIDYLYVKSPEGLRIRNKPDLSGDRTGVLYDRMRVKIISVGKEITIDGIKSNWIKILLPIETVQADENVYGWVFGGYLTDKAEPFSTESWTDNDLKRYLCRFSWVTGTGNRSYYQFNLNNSYSVNLLESGLGGFGEYSVSLKNKTITVKSRYADEDSESEIITDVYKIIKIEEDKLTLNIKGYEFIFIPSINQKVFYEILTQEKFNPGLFYLPSYYALMFPFSSDLIKKIDSRDFINKSMDNLIKMGIYVEDEEYEKAYNSYWN
ncbi:SH3 domain-containing protein [Treponema rectale]|uniref:SH3 domain-containing protein n=1 Tax=Treponema rectale TaxID=744512 RepID=A0A840SIZ2_9SPIR|nr:SH3 domain-containing protein [Treponema rectale]MBB5219361.1 hypothetical protein [Treponema rectale]QOS40755.1 SH3 domain-containing protein [Treponema rectale]